MTPTFLNREIASRAGRTKIENMTAGELAAFATAGGNALLRMYGVQYYSALGRKSAEKRSKRPTVCEEPSAGR